MLRIVILLRWIISIKFDIATYYLALKRMKCVMFYIYNFITGFLFIFIKKMVHIKDLFVTKVLSKIDSNIFYLIFFINRHLLIILIVQSIRNSDDISINTNKTKLCPAYIEYKKMVWSLMRLGFSGRRQKMYKIIKIYKNNNTPIDLFNFNLATMTTTEYGTSRTFVMPSAIHRMVSIT